VIPGGTALFKIVRRVQQSCGLATTAGIRCADKAIFLDLTDTRMLWVLPELLDESSEKRILRALVKPGDTFIDVGANHGTFSVIASELVGAGGMVIAFEPQPRLANLVSQSLAATAKSPFKVHQSGCSDRNGEVSFFIPTAGSGSAGVFQSFSGRDRHRELKIQLTTLDDALSQHTIGGSLFIKVDVEGSEYATLMGARKTIERFQPAILFELNPESSRAAGHTSEELIRLLAELGYENFYETDEFPKERRIGDLSLRAQRNLLILHTNQCSRLTRP
jgi:FkbM family methyltransferase